MATIVTRAGKGSPLTNAEVDANFTNLNADKLEASTAAGLFLALSGGTLTGKLNLPNPSSSGASLNIGQMIGSPSSPLNGDIWLDQGTSLRFRLGGANYTAALLNAANSFSAVNVFTNTVQVTGALQLYGGSGTTNEFGTSASTGTITIGGSGQTGTTTLDPSIATHILNIATGATQSGATKTINIGTGGLSTSSTAITIGSEFGTIATARGNWTFSSTAFFQDSQHYLALTSGNSIHNLDNTDYWNFARSTNVLTWISGGTTRATFAANGDFTASGNVTAYSDERLKKDWSELPQDFIQRLASVKSGTYTRVDSGERQIGVSAQSLMSIAPEGVVQGEHLSVAYGNVALAACVELAKRVVELEQKLAITNENIANVRAQ